MRVLYKRQVETPFPYLYKVELPHQQIGWSALAVPAQPGGLTPSFGEEARAEVLAAEGAPRAPEGRHGTRPCPGRVGQGDKRKMKRSHHSVTSYLARIISCNLFFFLAALGLSFCARAFSSCGEWGLLFVAVHGLLIAVASLVAEHRL